MSGWRGVETDRVAPANCSPGAPTDPYVRNYRIRFLKEPLRFADGVPSAAKRVLRCFAEDHGKLPCPPLVPTRGPWYAGADSGSWVTFLGSTRQYAHDVEVLYDFTA
jgi:hypothetical protein